MLVAAVGHDRRPDGVDGDERKRHLRPLHLVEEDELVGSRTALTAELGRPSDSQPAVAAELLDDAAELVAVAAGRAGASAHIVRHQLGEIRPQLDAQRLLVVGLGEVHEVTVAIDTDF